MTITTPLGKDVLFIEGFEGIEGLSRPFEFNLDLAAQSDHQIDFDKILGQNVTVKIVQPDASDRYFHGVVNQFAEGERVFGANGRDSFTRYEATIVPAMWFLKKKIRSRIFQQMTVPDI